MSVEFTISELAKEFGLTTRAIRFYEEQGLVAPRRDGRKRLFSQRDRVRLRLIKRGRRLGFSIDEIREVLDLYDLGGGEIVQLKHLLGKIEERRVILRGQLADIQGILEELDLLESQCVELLTEAGEM